MRKLFLAAALIAGSLALAGNTSPVLAQDGAAGGGTGAGGDVSTPTKSVPRVGTEKRDDSMNAGRPVSMRHVRHKRHRTHRAM